MMGPQKSNVGFFHYYLYNLIRMYLPNFSKWKLKVKELFLMSDSLLLATSLLRTIPRLKLFVCACAPACFCLGPPTASRNALVYWSKLNIYIYFFIKVHPLPAWILLPRCALLFCSRPSLTAPLRSCVDAHRVCMHISFLLPGRRHLQHPAVT